jgi:4'-phosphopantetheinyl transferase
MKMNTMTFNLTTNDIHIWQASLDQPIQRWNALADLLSPDETTRAAAFIFERDRRKFIVARAVLRQLLGRYLNINPRAVKFTYADKGKPSLADAPTLQFNVSHAHELALYAFGINQPLGIDLEYQREVIDMHGIARGNFSAQENALFNSLPDHLKQEAFFNCWTRKEAYIKALGEGLSHPLDTFDVTFVPNEPARLIEVRGFADEAAQWSFHAFTPQPNYIAALATRHTTPHINFHTWYFVWFPPSVTGEG